MDNLSPYKRIIAGPRKPDTQDRKRGPQVEDRVFRRWLFVALKSALLKGRKCVTDALAPLQVDALAEVHRLEPRLVRQPLQVPLRRLALAMSREQH